MNSIKDNNVLRMRDVSYSNIENDNDSMNGNDPQNEVIIHNTQKEIQKYLQNS